MRYVYRDGQIVPKSTVRAPKIAKSANFSTPNISRMEPYESPVTGKEVTSWGERDRELRANDCYDPRDVSSPYRRGRAVQLKEAQDERSGPEPTQLELPLPGASGS